MKLRCILMLLVISVGFVIFSWYVRTQILNSFDFAFTVKLQQWIDTSSHLRFTDFVGNIMEGSTIFGGPEFSVVTVLLLTVWKMFDRKKKFIHIGAFLLPIALIVLTLIEIYGKTVIHHPAPPFFMIKNPTSIFPKYYIHEEYSYPSGHAARSAFIAMSVFLPYVVWAVHSKKPLLKIMFSALIALVYVGLVSVSRIYLGHHWLSDVIGGILLGSACALASFSVPYLLTGWFRSHIIPKA